MTPPFPSMCPWFFRTEKRKKAPGSCGCSTLGGAGVGRIWPWAGWMGGCHLAAPPVSPLWGSLMEGGLVAGLVGGVPGCQLSLSPPKISAA